MSDRGRRKSWFRDCASLGHGWVQEGFIERLKFKWKVIWVGWQVMERWRCRFCGKTEERPRREFEPRGMG